MTAGTDHRNAGWSHLASPRFVAPRVAALKALIRYVWEHPSNVGHRPRALPWLARYQARARLTLRGLGECPRLWVDLHRTAASKVLYANSPDMPEMLVWRQALRGGDLLVDVGANVGTYTIWAAECGAEVMALEPAADTFALLLEKRRAQRLPGGGDLGRRRRPLRHRPVHRGPGRGQRPGSGRSGRDQAGHDRLLIGGRRVAGMKVNVESFEIDVLRAAPARCRERHIGLIQLEWNAMSQWALGTGRRPVADLPAQHGYQLFRPDPQGHLVPVTDPSSAPMSLPIPQRRKPPDDISQARTAWPMRTVTYWTPRYLYIQAAARAQTS